ncbi:glycosyltransferase family 2 protein [Klebsiella pneumoniae]
MDKKLIDIICPVYNKSKHIVSFLLSLKPMPEDDINIIIVDDGSSDGLQEIIKDYVDSNDIKNIFYFYKNNGGVSSARNLGIMKAVSKYIWFCDPDDTVFLSAKSILNELDDSVADIIVYGYSIEFEKSKGKKVIKQYLNKLLTSEQFLLEYDFFTKNNSISTVWNKLYRREFIGRVRFREDMNHSEDRYFNLCLLDRVASVCTSEKCIYHHYRYIGNTLSTIKTKSRIEDIIKADLYNLEVLGKIKDIGVEKKIHIYKIAREKMFLSHKSAKEFYFSEHKKLGVPLFPFVSIKGFLIFIILFF